MVTRKSEFHNPHADAAFDAGMADGQAGIIGGGWEYAGGTLEDSYRLGWLAGMAKQPVNCLPNLPMPVAVVNSVQARVLGEVKRLFGQPQSEAELMDADLEAFRAQPIVYLTDAMMAEIENARPGEDEQEVW